MDGPINVWNELRMCKTLQCEVSVHAMLAMVWSIHSCWSETVIHKCVADIGETKLMVKIWQDTFESDSNENTSWHNLHYLLEATME